MKTSSFLDTLRANASLSLVFKSSTASVAPGYHLTEVKEVTYRTMDCGAMTHRWVESQFEIWDPASPDEARERGYMSADKFLRIVDRVQRQLPLDGDSEARIFISLGGHPAALYAIDGIEAGAGRLVVSLAADATRCKARERREAEGCGCGGKTDAREPAAAVCCA
jgi:hypothetical protein